MTTRGQWIAVGAILAMLGGAVIVGMALSPDIRPVRPGSEAPDFQAANVRTGDTLSLSDYRGDVVLLNLWATWCAPCEREMPSMQRLHDMLGASGLRIVAVSVDEVDSPEVLAWAQDRDLTFDVLHNRSGRLERLYQTTGLPESFVIDRSGMIIKKEIGARYWDSPEQVSMFRRLLGSSDSAAAESDEQAGEHGTNP